jgi:hypothetical protein
MALFIAQENQQLLYEMIHKTPVINTVFPQVDEKNAWFRGVIEHFYQQITGSITREQLKGINRTALGYMVTQLQQRAASLTIQNKVPLSNTPFNTLKREHAPEYESREAQYKSLFDTPKPQAIDFTEKLEDEAITNMSELIENHKKMREQELKQYAPLPIAYEPTTDNISVKIMQDVPKEELQPTVINEKKVQFNIPQVKEFSSDVVKEIETIHTKIDAMESKLNQIFEFIMKKETKESPVDIIKEQMNTLSDDI